jgi:HNH endonuclease
MVFGRTNLAVQDMIGPRKEYFQRKRAAFVATWTTDTQGIVHIPLKDGFEAIFSNYKMDAVSKFTWRLQICNPKGTIKYYAEAKVPEELRYLYGWRTSLHRVIMGATKGTQIDHKNGNGLDCTDENLRFATHSQNTSNRHYKNQTGYRGVSKIWKSDRFSAQIEFQGKTMYLGSFDKASQAAKRYNKKAIELFGEFAILNEFEEDYDGDLSDLVSCDSYDAMETTVA